MQLFYGYKNEDGLIQLDEDESRHLKVLRKVEGDSIDVTDGNGTLYSCTLSKLGKKAILNIVEEESKKPLSGELHLLVSPTKNLDRMEWMVEKCCEIGVTSIQFIKCRFSERKNLKIERLQRKALSAMKQSKQFHLTQIKEFIPFREAIEIPGQGNSKYIAHCEEMNSEAAVLTKEITAATYIFIGPEGDFSEPEIEAAKEKGFKELHLGETILRTETAGMVATALYRNL